MKVKLVYLENVTFVFVGDYKGIAICSEHDDRNYAIGAAVALLKARPRFNEVANAYLDYFVGMYPEELLSKWVRESVEIVDLTDQEAMNYCMIRAELTNRIKDASKVEEEYSWDDGGKFLLGSRRRRGPDNAFIVEDCARKLVKACPSIARLDDA